MDANHIEFKQSLYINSMPIRVMTYNIRHGLNMKLKLDLNGIASVINKFNPDLVALQEIDIKTNRTNFIDELEELANSTQMNYYFSPAMTFQGGHYGVGVLSKYPIDYHIRYLLPQQSVESEPRTLGFIETQISGQKILFGSTHLDSKSSTNRLLQINKIISISNETEPKTPVIIAGDFNAKPNSEEIHIMKESFHDISENLGNTFPSDVPNIKIDYIFILNKFKNDFKLIEGQVVPETIASDHRPVFVNLQFEK